MRISIPKSYRPPAAIQPSALLALKGFPKVLTAWLFEDINQSS